MHPLLKALNDEFDDSCSVDSDAETIVPFAPDSTPAQALDTINPNSLDTCTPVLNTASTTAPTVLSPVFTSNATNSIHVDTCTPAFGKFSTSAPTVLEPVSMYNATNSIHVDTCTPVFGKTSTSAPTPVLAPTTTPNATNWKKTMTAKYDESVQEQEKSCQMQTADAETVVPLAPVSTPAKTPDTNIPISLDTCTPVLGISSTSTPAASTELAPFDCDQCSSVFQDKMQLKAHLKKVHLNEKPYQCSECRRQFSLMIELQNHVNKFHQDLLLQGIS